MTVLARVDDSAHALSTSGLVNTRTTAVRYWSDRSSKSCMGRATGELKKPNKIIHMTYQSQIARTAGKKVPPKRAVLQAVRSLSACTTGHVSGASPLGLSTSTVKLAATRVTYSICSGVDGVLGCNLDEPTSEKSCP